MFIKTKNPNKQGDIGMGLCIAYFTSRLFTVSLPLTDSQEYDLIVDDGTLKRVSIKTTTRLKSSGGFEVDLRTQGGNFTQKSKIKYFDNTSCDLIFVACSDGRIFIIPSEKINSKSTITVGGKFFNEFECRIGVNG